MNLYEVKVKTRGVRKFVMDTRLADTALDAVLDTVDALPTNRQEQIVTIRTTEIARDVALPAPPPSSCR